jgi:hypothetical protein
VNSVTKCQYQCGTVLLKEFKQNLKIRRAREVCCQVAVSDENNAASCSLVAVKIGVLKLKTYVEKARTLKD